MGHNRSSGMTLDEFALELRTSVEEFIENWRNKHQSQPLEFPLELEGGDWWEQFIAIEYEVNQDEPHG